MEKNTEKSYIIYKPWWDGLALGLLYGSAISTTIDLSDNSFDHPYAIGLPFAFSIFTGLYQAFTKNNKSCNKLEKKLNLEG